VWHVRRPRVVRAVGSDTSGSDRLEESELAHRIGLKAQ
jgi:hypothetical protein